jgi:signal transduction histidine kinase
MDTLSMMERISMNKQENPSDSKSWAWAAAPLVAARTYNQRRQALSLPQRTPETVTRLLQRQMSRQCSDMKQLSQGLAGELGQLLFSLKVDLFFLSQQAPHIEAVQQRVEQMFGTLNDGLQHVQQMNRVLPPPVLEDLGLLAALDWLVRQFEGRTGIGCMIQSDQRFVSISPDKDLLIFMLMRDILSNVEFHSRATRLRVQLLLENNMLHLSVADNGIGIRQDQILAKECLGLMGVRDHIELIGGQFSLYSAPLEGTCLQLEIPLAPTLTLDHVPHPPHR